MIEGLKHELSCAGLKTSVYEPNSELVDLSWDKYTFVAKYLK